MAAEVPCFTQPSFSFAGCGFLGVYHLGVVDCLQQHIPKQVLAKAKFAGASAGALVAASVVCNVPLDTLMRSFLGLAKEAYGYPLGAFDTRLPVGDILRQTLEEALPQDAHKLCSGRLYISVSRMKHLNFLEPKTMFQNDIISQFRSREHLLETLLCSSYIPVFSSSDNSILDKEITMDGFFSNNLPRVDQNTILVCPLSGDSHISPEDPEASSASRAVTISNTHIRLCRGNLCRLARCFFPASPEQLADFYRDGFDDALAFLSRNKLFRCPEHEGLGLQPTSGADGSWQDACRKCRMRLLRANCLRTYSLDPTLERMCGDMRNVQQQGIWSTSSMKDLARLLVRGPAEVVRLLPLFTRISLAVSFGNARAAYALLFKRQVVNVFPLYIDLLRDDKAFLKHVLMRGHMLMWMKNVSVLLDVTTCVVGMGRKVGLHLVCRHTMHGIRRVVRGNRYDDALHDIMRLPQQQQQRSYLFHG
ncbi:hypothetical protein ACOMHN_036504 [Nucella lapillus]